MAYKQEIRGINTYGIFIFSLALLLLIAQVAYADDKEEIIIQGEDRSPTQSSFEYERKPGSDSRRSMSTTEIPSAQSKQKKSEPKMKKNMQVDRTEEKEPAKTKLNRESSSIKWPAILGGLGLLLLIAS